MILCNDVWSTIAELRRTLVVPTYSMVGATTAAMRNERVEKLRIMREGLTICAGQFNLWMRAYLDFYVEEDDVDRSLLSFVAADWSYHRYRQTKRIIRLIRRNEKQAQSALPN